MACDGVNCDEMCVDEIISADVMCDDLPFEEVAIG